MQYSYRVAVKIIKKDFAAEEITGLTLYCSHLAHALYCADTSSKNAVTSVEIPWVVGPLSNIYPLCCRLLSHVAADRIGLSCIPLAELRLEIRCAVPSNLQRVRGLRVWRLTEGGVRPRRLLDGEDIRVAVVPVCRRVLGD